MGRALERKGRLNFDPEIQWEERNADLPFDGTDRFVN